MNCRPFVLTVLVFGALLHSASATATDKVRSPREQTVSDLRDLASPLTTERQRALLSLSLLTDPAVASELGVVEKLKAIVTGNESNIVIRCAALQTLVGLEKNNIQIPGLIEMLGEILQSGSKTSKSYPFQLRLKALDLLMLVASRTTITNGPDPLIDKTFNILTSLLNGKKDLPVAMTAGVYRCIGYFGAKKEARDLLMDGLRDPSPEVLEAVLESLRNAIIATKSTDRQLATMLADRFLKAGSEKDKPVRVPLLGCLESVISNMNDAGVKGSAAYTPTGQLLDTVQTMLKAGEDPEVVAAVHFLMRIGAQDPVKIANLLLSVATPNPQRPLSYPTLAKINMALVDVLIAIGNKTGSESTAAAAAIIKHMVLLLNPAEADSIPADLRASMILGLSCIPVAFERQTAVDTLIKLLELEAKNSKATISLNRDIENALTFLTGQTPFKIVSFEQEESKDPANKGVTIKRVETPDVARWQKWFNDNKTKLLPGKTPFGTDSSGY